MRSAFGLNLIKMREIKFRVWLKPEYWDETENKGLMTNGLPLGGFDKWWINLDEPFNENCSLDGEFTVGEQIEIMQFIGLKDKYGNEIYEGDILEFPFEMGIAFVISDGFRFAIESPGSGAVDYEDGNVIKTTTIIGNIYENPDFLQGIILADA